MKTRIFKTILVASLFSTCASAQFQLSGTVQDEEGKPIPNALITILKAKEVTSSDSTGFYQFSNLAKDEYQVKVGAFEYKTITQTVVMNQNQTVNFTLVSQFTIYDDFNVIAIRADERTPTTYSNLEKKDIERLNYGQDIPYLIASTPSAISTSDAGAGIGYTKLWIRGVDPTRTNVTIDGIPYNDAESQDVFWVNLPDLSSSAESIQIQRGVGTSTNGSSAFGASINISTDMLNEKPYFVSDNSFGSYNSLKNSISMGTGLLADKFTIDARLSRIVSDGYIARASSNLRSFFVSAGYHGEKSRLKFTVFGGKEKTYQSWYGTPESRINDDVQGMLDYAERNGLSEEQTTELLNAGRTYNAYNYENETDNYQQTHYHLHYDYIFSTNWKAKVGLHYTKGRGYFENFYAGDAFETYGFMPIEVGGDSIYAMDLVRQKWLDNHFYGGIFNVNYKNKGLDVNLGGGVNQYLGDHFDRVIWGEFLTDSLRDKRYFENFSNKKDMNIYLKANYSYKGFSFFGDLQYRFIDYSFEGIDEQNGVISEMTHRVFYHFFNPKAGLLYRINPNHSVYASYAIANREPVRADFRETTVANRPEAERLYNLEAGYRFTHRNGFFNANIYHMLYDNQLVLTGEINDVGGYTRSNVKNSYRYGIELEGGVKLFNQLGISANLTLSQNKIKNFVEYVDAFDEFWDYLPQAEIQYSLTDLAFSPNIIAGIFLDYEPISGLVFAWENKFIGQQFLDNTSNKSRVIKPYFVGGFDASYSFSFWRIEELIVGVRINNLYNQSYVNNGYTFSYFVGEDRIQENFYYPQAKLNVMGRLTIKL